MCWEGCGHGLLIGRARLGRVRLGRVRLQAAARPCLGVICDVGVQWEQGVCEASSLGGGGSGR